MSSAWIRQIIQDKEAQRELTKQNMEMVRRGESSAPMLFRTLKDRIARDVADFNRESGNTPVLDFHFNPSNQFTVRHSTFPVIKLDVTLKGAVIEYRRTEKKSSSADNIPAEEGEIFIMAGSNVDAAYFSIKGIEYREEEEISKILLAPIFQALP